MIIALDIGKKRVGLALSRDGLTVESARVLKREGGTAEREIIALLESNPNSTVVAGLPLNADGSRSPQCGEVERFCRRLEKRTNFKLAFVDEYGSSAEARQQLGLPDQPNRKVRQSGEIDAQAASIVLQQFLKSHRTVTNSK